VGETLNPRNLERLAGLLQRGKGVRVESAQLWHAFASAFPQRPSGPAERDLFLAALQVLQDRGEIRLPSPRGPRWDRSVHPAVPLSVDVVRPTKEQRSQDWRRFPWHPRLQWVLDLRSLPKEHACILNRVHWGLVNETFQESAPIKYRSLQLTGDEKRLDEMVRKSSLFTPGRLTLEMLNCFQETPPIAWEAVGPGKGMLIFENAGAFAVARRVLSEASQSIYGMVGYGGGQGILASLGHLLTIGRDVDSITYVGDLDIAGLTIAVGVCRRAASLGLPKVQPATTLHRAMIRAAVDLGYPQGWPSDRVRPSERQADGAVSFLAPDLQDDVVQMLCLGRRIPEEVLGPKEMREALDL
jgi:hypothetical protein